MEKCYFENFEETDGRIRVSTFYASEEEHGQALGYMEILSNLLDKGEIKDAWKVQFLEGIRKDFIQGRDTLVCF